MSVCVGTREQVQGAVPTWGAAGPGDGQKELKSVGESPARSGLAGGGACGPRRDCRGAVRCTPAASLSTSRRGALGGRHRPTAELVKHGKGPFALVACGA